MIEKEPKHVATTAPSETQTLRSVERLVAESLPPAWSFQSLREQSASSSSVDARWILKAPDGSSAEYVVEVNRSRFGSRLDDVLSRLSTGDGLPFVAAPYVSPTMRSALAERGASYADATGNLRIVSDTPGLYVERTGAARDPWPSDESLRSLRGRGAGRAVRALVDHKPPYGVRDIAQRAQVPLGTLSRVLDLLEGEGLVVREPRGPVTAVDWDGAIRRWAEDYDFARSNQVATFLEPRGIETCASKLAEMDMPYAITGAFAAQSYAPVAPARQIAIYVDDVDVASDRLGLRAVDSGANVILAEPYDPVVFDRTSVRDGLRSVAPSQLAVDLLTGPGREPSEGNELVVWMAKNQDQWRG